MNREVSHWMRGLSDIDGYPQIPFIATRGYDSVVWNRLYSRDISDLYEYQIDQVHLHFIFCISNLSSFILGSSIFVLDKLRSDCLSLFSSSSFSRFFPAPFSF